MHHQYAISATWWRQWCDFVNFEYQPLSRFYASQGSSEKGGAYLSDEKVEKAEGDYGLQTPESSNYISHSDEKHETFEKRTPAPSNFKRGERKTANMCSVISIQELYERPGKITNKHICEEEETGGDWKLRDYTQELYDYVLVNHLAWKYFKRWYGCDYEVLVL